MNFHEAFSEELVLLDRQGTSVDSKALARRVVRAVDARKQTRRRMVAASSLAAAAALAFFVAQLERPSDGPTIARELIAPHQLQDEAPLPATRIAMEQAPTEQDEAKKQLPAPRQAKARPLPELVPKAKAPSPRDSAEELLASALQNRSAGDLSTANQLLLQLRAEYAGTPQATVAVMYLARDAARSGQRAEARRLFEAAATEQPGGPLEREALGRLVELSDGVEKQDAARRYLARHPNGPHAAMANRALGKNP